MMWFEFSGWPKATVRECQLLVSRWGIVFHVESKPTISAKVTVLEVDSTRASNRPLVTICGPTYRSLGSAYNA